MSEQERSVCYADGEWHEGNPKLTGPMDHAFWMASVVFDGARAMAGLAPDLDQHCQRLCASALTMGLAPTHSAQAITDLCIDGIRRFPEDAVLYVRPMFYASDGFVNAEPESTRFVIAIHEKAMPPASGFTACLSTRTRPSLTAAPTTAKASCLYPNAGFALKEAASRGFLNAVTLDPNGNVAELATANLWIAKDGAAHTPAANGTFLAGITRARVIDLLRKDGIEVVERAIGFDEVLAADEVFSTGNYGKVLPITQVEDHDFQPGPVAGRARELYFDYAKAFSVR